MPEYETIALDTYHVEGLGPHGRTLDAVIYEIVDVDGTERFGSYDSSASLYSVWLAGGGDLSLKHTDQDPGTNPPGMNTIHQGYRDWLESWAQFWTSQLTAEGFTVVQKDYPIAPVPNDTEIWLYRLDYTSPHSRSVEKTFRSNNREVSNRFLDMEKEVEAKMIETYPEGRTDLLDG